MKKYIFTILAVIAFNIAFLDYTKVNIIGAIAIDIVICVVLNIIISYLYRKMKGKKDEDRN